MTFIFHLFIFECEIGEISFLGEGTEDLKKIIEKKTTFGALWLLDYRKDEYKSWFSLYLK